MRHPSVNLLPVKFALFLSRAYAEDVFMFGVRSVEYGLSLRLDWWGEGEFTVGYLFLATLHICPCPLWYPYEQCV